MNEITPKIYNELLNDIKTCVRTANSEARQGVLKEMQKIGVAEEHFYEFLGFGEEHKERQLKRAAIGKIENFLREMGGMFAFVGSQFQLKVSDKEYFIDLLLYHRALKSLVAIELKIGEFQPEYIGKMQFYLAVLNDKVKLADENPSIGIILCRDKDKTIVEYALAQSASPVGIANYELVSALPENLRGQLPTAEQISNLLQDID